MEYQYTWLFITNIFNVAPQLKKKKKDKIKKSKIENHVDF